jgi:hypothetical protein
MGSHRRNKKGTNDHREIVSDIRRQQDQKAISDAIQPVFEGTTYTFPIVAFIDWVSVREATGASQG